MNECLNLQIFHLHTITLQNGPIPLEFVDSNVDRDDKVLRKSSKIHPLYG